MTMEDKPVALIAGITGLVGNALSQILLKANWKVYGVARSPQKSLFKISTNPKKESDDEKMELISCDLTDKEETLKKLSPLKDTTHVFWLTWAAHTTYDSMESYVENKKMFSNALNALLPFAKGVKHISLQTGTKHYNGTHFPFTEDSPRQPNSYNFYYGLEDVLFDVIAGRKREVLITWSVHRPGIILGQSTRSLYNVVGSLCVYALICKALGLPLLFPGSRVCWEEATIDFSDARLIAEQHLWAATEGCAHNNVFNAINGDAQLAAWKNMWPVLAHKFGIGLDDGDLVDESMSLVEAMADKGPVWDEIVESNSLYGTRMNELADWWLLDVMFKVPFKLLASGDKCREYGFVNSCDSAASLAYWIDRLREGRIIP